MILPSSSSPIIIIIVFALSAQISSVFCIGFSFTSFTPGQQGIILSDGTAISEGSLRLSGGRPSSSAYFNSPVPLWHRRTNETASFSTYFEFLVSFPSSGAAASNSSSSGFAFFLAPAEGFDPRSTDALGSSNGTGLAQRLLAVEFDLFRDNSSFVNGSSAAAAAKNGSLAVEVSYNAASQLLQVGVRNLKSSGNSSTLNLSRSVDVRQVLPDRVMVGFSATNRSAAAVQRITTWNFTSDLEPEESKKFTFETWMAAPVAGLVIALLAAASIYCLWGREGSLRLKILYWFLFALGKLRSLVCGLGKGRGKSELSATLGESAMDDEFFSTGTGPRRFSYRELAAATSSFSEKQLLGEGGFGGVYRGFLNQSGGREVAVKKISSKSKQGKKEYASEVKIISRLRHRNLVQLLGWCHERGEFLLVYEFLPNGSLDGHLFNGKTSLPWPIRFNVALGLAKALLYLHEEWEQCVVHRDVKSSNVMLDSAFDAKLGDFGLARLVDHQHGGQHATRPAGTLGYLAPECFHTGRASKESDVYSFGVVALEIATGRRAVEHEAAAEEEVRLVEWVWELNGRGRLLDAADRTLGGDYDGKEMERVMLVGLWSAHPDHSQRPSMREVIQAFTFEAVIPPLPKKMPVPVFEAPPTPTPTLQGSNYSAPTVTFGSLTAGR